MNGKIYCIKNKINEKVYVGQTTKSIEERFYQHIYSYTSPSNSKTPISKAFREFGKENFEITILADGISSKDELNLAEEEYISRLNSLYPNGYNVSPGGNEYKRKPIVSKEDIKMMIEMYANGESTRNIASHFNISKSTVGYHLKKNGYALRSKSCNLPDRTSVLTKEIMVDLYLNKRLKIKEIAEIYGVDAHTVNRAKRRYNLNR